MKKYFLLLCTIYLVSCTNKDTNSNRIICANGYKIYLDSLNNLKGIKYNDKNDSLIITFYDKIEIYNFNGGTRQKIYYFDKNNGLFKIDYVNCLDTSNCVEQILKVDTISKSFSVKGHSSFISSSNIPDTMSLGESITINHRVYDSVFPLYRLNVSSSEIPFNTERKKIIKSVNFYNTKGVLNTITFSKKGYNYYNGYIDNYKLLKDSTIATIQHFFNYRIYVK